MKKINRGITQDLCVILLIIIVCFINYGVPLLKYPSEASNPWPYAYTVIQKEIIADGNVPPSSGTPQFGQWAPIDMGFFLVHHLNIVPLKLLTGLEFEILERILSLILSIILFLAIYTFAKTTFGRGIGLTSLLFILFIPRLHNYLLSVNGEFLGWIILFTALFLFFKYVNTQNRKYMFISFALAGVLPLSNLIVAGVYFLFIGSYLIAEVIAKKDFKRVVTIAALSLAIMLVIAIPPLCITGDITPGPSSTVGSLFSQKSPEELHYEQLYYDRYAVWGQTYLEEPPLIAELKYISQEWMFKHFVFMFFLPFGLLGLVLSVRKFREPRLLFPTILMGLTVATTAFLFSDVFGYTIWNVALRLLLYFGFSLAILAGIGLHYVITTFRLRYGGLMLISIFLLSFLTLGQPVIQKEAYSANSYVVLYAQPYSDVLSWVKENTPEDAMLISNDWTGGIFWVKANRMTTIEGGKASAGYLTYKEIYTRLEDSTKILTTNDVSETIELMNKYKSRWVVIWNRPSSYYSAPMHLANTQKFEMCERFERCFEAKESGWDNLWEIGYDAHSIVYYLVDNSPYYPEEILGTDSGLRAGCTDGVYVATYKKVGLRPQHSISEYKRAQLCLMVKRVGNVSGTYSIKIDDNTLDINVADIDIPTDWTTKYFDFPVSWLSEDMTVTLPLMPDWDPTNQIYFGTDDGDQDNDTYYSLDNGETWKPWSPTELQIRIILER